MRGSSLLSPFPSQLFPSTDYYLGNIVGNITLDKKDIADQPPR